MVRRTGRLLNQRSESFLKLPLSAAQVAFFPPLFPLDSPPMLSSMIKRTKGEKAKYSSVSRKDFSLSSEKLPNARAAASRKIVFVIAATRVPDKHESSQLVSKEYQKFNALIASLWRSNHQILRFHPNKCNQWNSSPKENKHFVVDTSRFTSKLKRNKRSCFIIVVFQHEV